MQHTRGLACARTYIDGALVELHAEEVGDDGVLAREAGPDDALDHRLHVVAVALALVEAVLQLGAGAGGKCQDGDGHHERRRGRTIGRCGGHTDLGLVGLWDSRQISMVRGEWCMASLLIGEGSGR